MPKSMFAPCLLGRRRGAVCVVGPGLGLCTRLAGCAGTGERLASMVAPCVDVVQGNFISREQAHGAAARRKGASSAKFWARC